MHHPAGNFVAQSATSETLVASGEGSCINSCGRFVGMVVLQESTPDVADPLMTFEQFDTDELDGQVGDASC